MKDEIFATSSFTLFQLNLVHFETWSSAGKMPANAIWEQDAPTTFKTMVLKIDVV